MIDIFRGDLLVPQDVQYRQEAHEVEMNFEKHGEDSLAAPSDRSAVIPVADHQDLQPD